MSVMDNGAGWMGYRCWHRGKGCDVPRFSNKGLLRSALLALREVRDNAELQTAIRSGLERRSLGRQDQGRRRAERNRQVADLEGQRRKLLQLYYADKISPEGFELEERRITTQLAALTTDDEPAVEQIDQADQFEQVLTVLADLDWDRIWEAATDNERRILLDEFVPQVEVHPDHLEVELRGVPRLNVALHEVGLRNRSVENSGVGGGPAP